jgi:rhodanese-related sulfurtransferase
MIDQVQPAQLQDWIASQAAHGPTVVLDVREDWELQTACVTAQGFELVKIPMNTIPPRLAELQRDQPIAVLCHHGSRSMQVRLFWCNKVLAMWPISRVGSTLGHHKSMPLCPCIDY